MKPAGLIICEQTRRWTVAVGHALRSAGKAAQQGMLYQVRRLEEIDEPLAEAPGSVVAVEVTSANLAEALSWLSRLEQRDRWARSVALVTPETSTQHWTLREAGARLALDSPRQVQSLVDFIAWHLARVPAPQQTETERIRNRLPWNKTL